MRMAVAIYVTGISTPDLHPESPPLLGTLTVDAAYEDQVGVLVPKNLREGDNVIDLAASAREFRDASSLGDLPLIVLTHGEPIGPPRKETLWSGYQEVLAGLSANSVHAIATLAKHYIQQDQPQVVIAAVRSMWETVTGGGSLPTCRSMFAQLPVDCL